jgi:flavin-dependent dehydrogenase
MSAENSADILIVGAGPAGLSTALHLAQRSPELAARTLVLEKAHHPRPKLCAGALVVDAEVILQRLGLDCVEVPHVDARVARFFFRGRGLSVRLRRGHTLRIIRRDEFDAWLAAKARERGIRIREGVTVKTVRPGPDGVAVETSQGLFRARAVVGADGSNGVVRRSVVPQAPLYTARVLEVLAAPREDDPSYAREAIFDFRPVPEAIAGYTWDFPALVKGQPVRVWGIYDANLFPQEKRPALKDLLAEEMARHGYTLEDYELKGHPIRWFDPFNPVSVPGVLLAGDAAGADSIFGEGISMALGYGRLAAGELRRAFAKNDFSFRGTRGRLLRSPLGGALMVRWLFTWILYGLRWRWLQFLIWRLLQPVVALLAVTLVINWARRSR